MQVSWPEVVSGMRWYRKMKQRKACGRAIEHKLDEEGWDNEAGILKCKYIWWKLASILLHNKTYRCCHIGCFQWPWYTNHVAALCFGPKINEAFCVCHQWWVQSEQLSASSPTLRVSLLMHFSSVWRMQMLWCFLCWNAHSIPSQGGAVTLHSKAWIIWSVTSPSENKHSAHSSYIYIRVALL